MQYRANYWAIMPKKLAEDLNSRIATEVARYPNGVGIDGLHAALGDMVSRRTLQRRLSELVEHKHLAASGQARARLYRAPVTVNVYLTQEDSVASGTRVYAPEGETYVPITAGGKEVLDYVRQPIQYRRPVGYNRELLEGYRPNETHYLPKEVRDHLRNIGRSPVEGHPAGTYARDLLGRLLIDLSWASSRLEGNTYSRLDTQNLIELGREATGKDRREARMILNHKAAIELLVEQAEDIGFNAYTFFNLHALLSEGLLVRPAEGGRLRERIVEVSGSVFHPLGIPQQIEAHFRMILDKAAAIADPFEQAFFVMVHIPYLQPFIDVNKRVSRLGANIPLIRNNLCPLSFVDVPERAYVEGTLGVYELNRTDLLCDVFIWAYERSCQRYMAIREIVADPDPVRLHYREAIVAIVAEIVRGLQTPDKAAVHAIATTLVPPEDLDRVTAMVLDDLKDMHEGNVSRYRLRLSEYRAWQPLQQP